MKKNLKYFGMAIVMIILLSSGTYLGMKWEQYNNDKINGSLSNATKIALVNLDEGIIYQDEQRNFVNEILTENSEDYTLTGLEDAKNGTKDGRYSAFVIFPSDFSKNVISINSTPVKSLLKYEISGTLSTFANDKAWQNIMKLKEKLNDDIGYMYISSILGEFHTGQENALKVIANDSKDKEVLMAISNLDLIAILDLKEVERLQNNMEGLDINPDIEKNKKIIESIDATYKGYLLETSDQLNSLKTESSNVSANNQKLLNTGQNIKNLENDDGSLNYTTTNTNDFLTQFNADLALNLKSVQEDIKQKNERQTIDNQNYISTQTGDLSTLLTEVQNNHIVIEQAQKTTLKKNIDDIVKEFLDNDSFSWDNYPEVKKILDAKKLEEPTRNAVNYIDKLILSEFIAFNYNMKILDYETIISNMEISTQSDEKLRKSLQVYAISIGKTEEEALNYTIKDYLNTNNDVQDGYPDIDSTENTDQFLLELETALTIDSKNLMISDCKELKTLLKNSIDNLAETNVLTDVEGLITKYQQGVSNLPTTGYDDIQELVDAISPITITDVNEKMNADLKDLANQQKTNKILLINELQSHSLYNSIFHNNLILYDPLKFINQNEIESFVRDYNNNNSSTKYKIENKDREYITFVSESYSNANEHVASMKEDIRKYQTESNDKVTIGLENAKKIRSETASSNNTLMNDYISKLPYTKTGTVGNSYVYDFVTAPTDMEGVKRTNSSSENSANFLLWFAVTSVGLTTAWTVMYVVFKCRKRSK